MPAINESNLQRILKRGLRKHQVPGASLAVMRNGRVTATAAGMTNLSTQVPATTDTVFQIGSISKIFTTTLIMQLVDEGRIDLDAPVRTYLPDFAVGDADVSRLLSTLQHFGSEPGSNMRLGRRVAGCRHHLYDAGHDHDRILDGV